MIRAFNQTLILLTLVASTGCVAPSYINIPPLKGDTALHNPNDWVVRDVMVESLKKVIRDYPPAANYSVSFPQGVSEKSRALMIEKLPHGLETIWNSQNPTPIYAIKQVWVRGLNAQVDIIVPQIAGEPRLVSVFCVTDIEGWYGRTSRIWRLPVEQALQLAQPVDPNNLPTSTNTDKSESTPDTESNTTPDQPLPNLGASDKYKKESVKLPPQNPTPADPNNASNTTPTFTPVVDPQPESESQPASDTQSQNTTQPTFIPTPTPSLPALTQAPTATPTQSVPPSTSIQNTVPLTTTPATTRKSVV